MTISSDSSPENSSDSPLNQEFRDGLQSGKFKTVTDFIASLQNDIPTSELLQLITIEMDYRQAKGETIELKEFLQQMPDTINEDVNAITKLQLHETTAARTDLLKKAKVPAVRKIVEPGDTLDDFELVAELGKGSFATVFLARQKSMQRMVALKISNDHGLEAQTLAQLDHPNIVRVFDQRPAEEQKGLQLLYMQYLEGGTLLDVLRNIILIPEEHLSGKSFVECVDAAIIERGASPQYESSERKQYMNASWEKTICNIGYRLAKALAYAHEKGVLHRDIKPANVLIGSDYSVKLADFNISSAENVVGDSKFGGSLVYMSPEQIRAFNIDDDFDPQDLNFKCDIYSLGVMLYQLLKKELPFYAMSKSRSADGLNTMIAEREHSIDRILSSLKGYSPLLKNALVRCLQPKLEDRPASARDLANQLKVGLDKNAQNFLFPTKRNWTIPLRKFYHLVCIGVCFVFNLLGALFVKQFNLIDSVPAASKDTFLFVVNIVNFILFPSAMVIFLYLTWIVGISIKRSLDRSLSDDIDLKLAMHRTLSTGHIQAVICGSLWLLAGVMYPVIMISLGTKLDRTDWMDFIASHTLAGIAITALTFFAITYLALRVWLPVLIQNSFTEKVVATVTSGLNSLLVKIPIYQMLAVSVPLLAIALLVMYKDSMSDSEQALRVISVFGLVTIPIVLYGGNRIRAVCENLLVIFREDG